MAARATMADLITLVRGLIYDPTGATQVFSDDQVQTALDGRRTDVYHLSLSGQGEVGAGGVTTYRNYYAGVRHWEGGETVQNGSWATITPTTVDRVRGVWNFSAGYLPPVYVTGSHYDVYGAASDLVDQWLSRLALTTYDFSADGGDYKRSQIITNLTTLRDKLVRQAVSGVAVAQMYTGDV